MDASVLLKRSNSKIETQAETKTGVMHPTTTEYRLLQSLPGPVSGWPLRAAVALFESPVGTNAFKAYRGWNVGLASIWVSCAVG